MIKFYAKEKGQKIDLKSSLPNYFRFKIYLMNSNRLKISNLNEDLATFEW